MRSTAEQLLTIGGDAIADPVAGGTVVSRGNDLFVVTAGLRYWVDGDAEDPVLRAVGFDGRSGTEVDGAWLNLFSPGADLEPLVIPGAGSTVSGSSLVVGAAVHPEGAPEAERYVVTARGELAPLSPLAYQLYLLGTGADVGAAVDVGPAQLAALPTASAPAGGANWPTMPLEPVPAGAVPCALLGHDDAGAERTVLATADGARLPGPDEVRVAVDAGALVRTGAEGDLAHLIDATGTAFAIPGADADILGRLGYEPADVKAVSTAWLQFLPAGPELTVAAAGSSPAAAADASLADCEPGQVVLTSDTPTALAKLQAASAWQLATGAGVVVAVVDSGIDVNNPHLTGVVAGGVDLVGDGVGPFGDPLGHGTAIAGVIAARAIDGSGVVGLAPEAQLLSVRVFRGSDQQSVDAGFGPRADRIAAGIRWAADSGADIINVSLSINADVAEVRDAVAHAAARGSLVVASAGNRASTEDVADTPRYPAANSGALAVTATDALGVATHDSIHGPHVEVAAPGTDVLTLATGGGDCLFATAAAGSSFATGYASAAAALVAQAHPFETPAQWEYRLQVTADRDNPDHRDDLDGWGMIRPADAIALLPDRDLRGPLSPFFDTAGGPLVPPAVALEPDHSASPFDLTRDGMVLLAVGAATAIGTLGAIGILVAFRRRPAIATPVARGAGLLDRPTSDL